VHTKLKLLAAILVMVLFSTGCLSSQAKTKNVIMIIGDGMGPQQIGLLEAYASQAPVSVIKSRTTAFNRMLKQGAVLGLSMTHANNVLVTDSASAATQLASGQVSGSEMIGLNAEGNPTVTLVEIAKQLGKSSGLVSDVRLTHATPAAFAAHQPHRSMENQIAEDMLATAPDVMLSGGLRHWIPQQANDPHSDVYKQLQQMTTGAIKLKSKRTDQRNLLIEAREQGYQLAFTKSQLAKSDAKVLGLFATSAFPDAISYNKSKTSVPSLTQMSAKALDILSKNENGFFLMIEAGLIDWAAHYNDTGTMLHEMVKINEVLEYVLDWVKQRDDTLLIVTADHETGGFGFSFSAADIPKPKAFPGEHFKNSQFSPVFNFGDPQILEKIYAQKSSYTEIFSSVFDRLPKPQQTSSELMKIINQQTQFPITEAQASRILQTEENPYYVENHKYLGNKIVPEMLVNGAFFVYQADDNRQNLLAQEVATQQSVTWSNGTHTASPVLVFAKGDASRTDAFKNLLNHRQVGQLAISALLEKE